MKKWKYSRPKFSRKAAFKTLLKVNGFNPSRNFYGFGCCIAKAKGKMWRFRFDAGVVDISCSIDLFDRWANSTEKTITIQEFKDTFLRKSFMVINREV